MVSAFSVLAPTYDADFTESPIARFLRQRIHTRLDQHFHTGDTVLELGGGTGEDALHLARRGVRVLATDANSAMLDAARAKTEHEPLVTVMPLDLNALHDLPQSDPLDGAFSNFGALNCMHDWQPLAEWLARRVKPGGVAAFGVMSPLCLWELAWHGLHGDFRTAARRLRGRATFQPTGSPDTMPIHYPTIRRLTRDFAPWFTRVHVQGVGVFLPPSDAYGVVEKRPRLLNALTSLERRFGASRPLALLADHYWIEFRRNPAP